MSQQSVYRDNKGHVGLELMKGEVAEAVLEAIKEINQDVKVTDLPGFIIVEVPGRMRLEAELVREHLGKNDWTMQDLNEVTPVYTGNVEVYTEDTMVLSWNKKLPENIGEA